MAVPLALLLLRYELELKINFFLTSQKSRTQVVPLVY